MANGAGSTSTAVRSRRRSIAKPSSGGPVGAPSRQTPEVVVARLHSSARRLFLPVVAVTLVSAATGYLYGRLGEEWERVALPFVGATLAIFLFVFPLMFWLNRVYVITTRRVVIKRGFFFRSRQELLLTRGHDVTLHTGPLQLLFGSGDVVIGASEEESVVLRDVPKARIVQAALADLMEYSSAAGARAETGPNNP